jgi:hypothetical protein
MALRFGVNYVPSQQWWYSWADWDDATIAADLEAIAALGMDHIRAHCLWPLFQPNPSVVSAMALCRLARLLDLADAVGLDVQVTVLNGWLSGFVFLPAWVGATAVGPARNIFTDAELLTAERLLFGAIAAAVSDHPRFLGFDLGNELGVLHSFGHPATPARADAWAAELLAYCEQLAPGKLHVNGVDHSHWFGDMGFSRRQLSTTGAATSLHAWIKFTGALERYGPAGAGTLHLAEYCIELARAYHTRLDRPIWLQEFGCSSTWLAAAQLPDFAEQTVRNAAGSAHLWGLTWWCSHDLPGHLEGFAECEYDMGLLDTQNRVKPAGRRMAELIQEFRASPPTPPARPVALVLPDTQFALDASTPDWSFGTSFMELVADGVRPAVILGSQAEDHAYRAARGIRELVYMGDRAA